MSGRDSPTSASASSPRSVPRFSDRSVISDDYGSQRSVQSQATPHSVQSQATPRTPSSRLLGTPHSSNTPHTGGRSDLGSHSRPQFYRPVSPSSHLLQSQQSESDLSMLSQVSEGGQQSIWGTTIDVSRTQRHFEQFIMQHLDPTTGQPLYPRVIEEIAASSIYYLNLNCAALYDFNATLYSELVHFPGEFIALMDQTVTKIRNEMFPAYADESMIQVRPFNLAQPQNQRELDPRDIDSLVSIKGLVIRCGSLIPELRTATFICSFCNYAHDASVIVGEITEPASCDHCKMKRTMQLVHNRGVYGDKQIIRIQETPDEIPDGETPHTVTIYVYEDLVDTIKPGDRVTITGIYRALPVRVSAKQRAVKNVFKTFLDAIHFKKLDNRRQTDDGLTEQQRQDRDLSYSLAMANAETTKNQHRNLSSTDTVDEVVQKKEAELVELSKDPRIYDRLMKSLAPSIWELEDVKKGLLCQLFGGGNTSGAASGRSRGEINILLCGDPGTSKSQLLGYVHKLAPRGIYTSGKGSSAVGLTAYITKDPGTNEMVLESGALVLSDRGICCIDEFDKMSDSTRSILHEVMEQQTVSIAKAGIVCTLNARTSILASANPKQSRYNPKLSVVQNIELGPTLLSRFDLIYLVLDVPNETSDNRLAKHLISMYYSEEDRDKTHDSSLISMDVLAHYISYARKNIHPQLSDEAVDALTTAYQKLRSVGQMTNRKIITATPRQLESLMRLSESIAKMRFSTIVTRLDVEEAARLMFVATQTAATNPETGEIDMDLLYTGQSSVDRERKEQIKVTVKEFLNTTRKLDFTVPDLLAELNENSGEVITEAQLAQVLLECKADGLVDEISKGPIHRFKIIS